MPYAMLMRFAIPVFVVVLILALLLGAAPFWAAAAAALVTIASEVLIDAVWRRRHEAARDQHE
jgi:hypothetical protein